MLERPLCPPQWRPTSTTPLVRVDILLFLHLCICVVDVEKPSTLVTAAPISLPYCNFQHNSIDYIRSRQQAADTAERFLEIQLE